VLPSSGLVPPWLLNGNACITTTRLNVIWWGTCLFISSGDNMAQSICSGNNMAPQSLSSGVHMETESPDLVNE
jgi:hypothetical protein